MSVILDKISGNPRALFLIIRKTESKLDDDASVSGYDQLILMICNLGYNAN